MSPVNKSLMAKMERWLLLCFVFSIPIQARVMLARWTVSSNEWTSGFLWGTDILFALVFALFVITRIPKVRPRPRWYVGDSIIALFVAGAFVSVFAAFNEPVAWYRLGKLVEYVLMYFVVRESLRDTVRPTELALIFAISGLIQSFIGIVQYVLQRDIGLWILGESPLDVYGPGVAVVAVEGEKYLRAYGTTPHPNVLALCLVFALWCIAWLYGREMHHIRTKILIISYSIVLFAFLLTFSRVAILAWGVASLVMLAASAKQMLRGRAMRMIYTSAIVGAIFALMFWPQVKSRLSISGDDEAVSQRIFYAKIAGENTDRSPIFGYGIGQFVPRMRYDMPHYPSFMYQPVHNIYLLILNELGIVGLCLFVALIARTFYGLRRNIVLVSVLGVVLFLGMFDHYLWTLQQGGILMWLVLGFLSWWITNTLSEGKKTGSITPDDLLGTTGNQ